MATENWPWDLATIVVDAYELDDADNVRRTPMADGAVDQRQISNKVFKIRRFEVLVKSSKLTAFRSWVNTHGKRWFNYTDIDDNTERDCRIVGGKIPLTRQRGQLLDGEVVWRGSGELEGYE